MSYMTRFYQIFLIILTLILSLGCTSKNEMSTEQIIIKHLYDIPCHTFRMDTLSSFDKLVKFTKNECQKYPEESFLTMAFIYNLSDSSFVPSLDAAYNCKIPCAQANPGILKWVPNNDFYINNISSDSLTIEFTDREPSLRIHINELNNYFSKHVIKLLKYSKLQTVDPIIVNIEISNNPTKELFYKVFNTLFWTYYGEAFTILRTSYKDKLDDLIKDPKYDCHNLFGYNIPIWILLSDSTVSHKRAPILVK
jgi:hypothetical protein